MKRISLLLLPFLVLGAVAVSCGGGGKKTTITIDKTTKVSVDVGSGAKVPSDFPSNFPQYKGASVQVSASNKQLGDLTGSWVMWTTKDSVDDVTSFYKDAFNGDSWKVTANGTIAGSSWWAADSSDGKLSTYVSVSGDGGQTSIQAVVTPKDSSSSSSRDSTSTSDSSSSDSSSSDQTPSDSSSSDSSSEPTAASEPLPDEVKLSDNFPKDRVPLPDGARVTSDSSYSSGGQTTNIIEVYVKDTPENISKFFEAEAPKKGWENAFSSQTNGEYFLTFSTSTDEGLTIGIQESDTPGYAKVTLTVVISG